MEKNTENLTIKERYRKLDNKKKAEVRDLFIATFEYSYPSFYWKLNNDSLKTVEREYLQGLL